ncbi:MAG TPA: lactate utilization protein [Bacillota bacterium]|nr:lactate utilization protein [Bacillota bacterium]
MANLQTTRENLIKKGYQVSLFANKEEATAYLTEQIQGKTVAFGGSMTTKQMGLDQALAVKNCVLWHWTQTSAALLPARTAQVYIASVNGMAETGEWVNIDGSGNRVAGTIFGSQAVYLVVGKNKIVPDLSRALWRAKNIAAPLNAQRLHCATPCAVKADKCYDCDSPGRICNVTSIFERKPNGVAHYEVILIDEELGY